MLLKIIKDLLWKNQFSDTENKRLDRDRYFIAQLLLLMITVLAEAVVVAIPPNGFPIFDVSRLLALLWLAAQLLLAYRAVGKWLALPLALVNIGTAHFIINLLHIAANTRGTLDSNILLGEFGICLLWLLFHIFWFRKLPTLARQQPKHPLLQYNPNHKSDGQLHAVGYFWQNFRLLLWNIIPMVLLVLGSAHGIHWYDQGITFCLATWGILLGYFSGRMLYRRSLNIGWHFGKTLALLLLPLVASLVLKNFLLEIMRLSHPLVFFSVWLQMFIGWFSIAVVALLVLKTPPQK
ncbi:hypothetical protein [Shewanella sp.]|uniref:hypothetical protein n=1 Tax=Shewanella sp. TaxID=50422 RepID=UPI003A96AEE2